MTSALELPQLAATLVPSVEIAVPYSSFQRAVEIRIVGKGTVTDVHWGQDPEGIGQELSGL